MTLLVDIGNTRVKWCLVEKGGLAQHHFLFHRGDLARLLEDPAWCAMARPARVVISCVLAREQADNLASWIGIHWGCAAQFVVPLRQAHGVTNAYDEAQRLGADRWAALIGAHHTIGGAVCLFDCGTALTVDVLDATGRHRGGLIMPGLKMMRDALVQQSGALRSATNQTPAEDTLPLLATDTRSAITGGTLHALVAVMERVVRRVEAEWAHEIMPVITGGDAESLLPWIDKPYQYRPDLVLQGLAVIAGEET